MLAFLKMKKDNCITDLLGRKCWNQRLLREIKMKQVLGSWSSKKAQEFDIPDISESRVDR